MSIIMKIVLRDSRPVELHSCQCSCVAGTVLCNHVAAVLYQTAQYSQQKLTSVPPVHSCTETEQRWHKPRSTGIKPGPVNDMVILSARPRERRLMEGIRSNLYRGVTSPLPEPSCLNVGVIYQDLLAYLAPMITTMAISHDVPLVDSLFGPVQEGSVLCYQMPTKAVPRTCPHSDAPSPPQLPLLGLGRGQVEGLGPLPVLSYAHYNNTITWHPLKHLWRQPTKLKKLRKNRVHVQSGTSLGGPASLQPSSVRSATPGHIALLKIWPGDYLDLPIRQQT
ncbi:uncharacterized protein [Osmerus mordax]|uniref:uncharacterized protein n=1 Tax=Osmerus mordax TaxID=8014 RepID=UPI00350FE6D9